MRARHPGYEFDSYEEFCMRSPQPLPEQVWIPQVSWEDLTESQLTPEMAGNVIKEIKDDNERMPAIRSSVTGKNKKDNINHQGEKVADDLVKKKKPVKVKKENTESRGRVKKEKKASKTKLKKIREGTV